MYPEIEHNSIYTYTYSYIHIYIYIYIYIFACAVKLGSGPFWRVWTARFWTELTARFWTKMILDYFCSGFGQFLCATVSVCVVLLFGSLFSINVVKMAFFDGSEKVGFS